MTVISYIFYCNIQRTVFFNVYKKRRFSGNIRIWVRSSRPTKADRQGLFSVLVYCADCGNKLHFALCRGNLFLFCHAAETARHIGTQKVPLAYSTFTFA